MQNGKGADSINAVFEFFEKNKLAVPCRLFLFFDRKDAQMKNILITILLLTIGMNILSGQNGQPHLLIKQSKVKKIETYFFEPDQTADSLLLTVEEFNKEGRREKIEIYNSSGLGVSHEYYYLNDTIPTERRSYNKNELKSVTTTEYDQFGNEISTMDYDEKGNKTGWRSKKKYNKKHQEIESKVCVGKKIVSHEKRKYHKNGNLKEIKVIKPKRHKQTIKHDKNGERIESSKSNDYLIDEVFENYESSGKKLVRTERKIDYRHSIIGVKGRLDLETNDILKTEILFRMDGLLDYKIQYLNGELIGTKKYKYVSLY